MMSKKQMNLLKSILRLKRPYGGAGEKACLGMVKNFAERHGFKPRFIPGCGLEVVVGNNDALFVAHCDTVHPKDGTQSVWESDGILWTDDGECLGADDGAGVWFLCELIRLKMSGTYLFTIGEECGGIGARAYVCPVHIGRSFEFDRRGTHEVIMNHGASRGYAEGLAELLGMRASNGGSFTDIAVIAGPVEAVNISCGYQNAHGPSECLDTDFLAYLLNRFVTRFEAIMRLKLVGVADDFADLEDYMEYHINRREWGMDGYTEDDMELELDRQVYRDIAKRGYCF